MNKHEITDLVNRKALSFDDYYEFLDWLYSNGYHIVKEYDSPSNAKTLIEIRNNLEKMQSRKPKSKFIEEYENMESKTWERVIELIDKHLIEVKDALEKLKRMEAEHETEGGP